MRVPFVPVFFSAAIVAASITGCDKLKGASAKTAFDAQAAMNYTKQTLDFGPRVPGTPAHDKTGDWIVAEMKKRTDSVMVQSWTQTTAKGDKLPMRYIFARFNPSNPQRVLYVTHWDTRPVADEDPNLGNRARPFPGANDGASGVGMFLALADVFRKTPPAVGVDLLLVDGEDWGSFDPTDSTNTSWPDALFGSQYFVNHLPSPSYKPLYGVLWDMIADKDQQFYEEGNSVDSAPEVVNRVWQTAADLGYGDHFLKQAGDYITDDHLPFLAKGMHVIDVLDLQYGPLPSGAGPQTQPNPNYHHTMGDTFDKLSAKSFQVVGDVAVTLVSPPKS